MATNGNTYDLSPPRPPNLADFNGAQKQDDGGEPPDPTTMPNAPEDNTCKQTLVAMGQILPLIEVSVDADASPAVIVNVLSPVSAIQGNPAAFYLTRTAAGNYHVEIGNGLPVGRLLGVPAAQQQSVAADETRVACAGPLSRGDVSITSVTVFPASSAGSSWVQVVYKNLRLPPGGRFAQPQPVVVPLNTG